jgi:hypothetical protein
VRQKFTRHQALRDALLATGTEALQEGNRWSDASSGVDLRSGRGQNHLGRLFMAVRQRRMTWATDREPDGRDGTAADTRRRRPTQRP